MPNRASSICSGKGGSIGVPSTKCGAVTGIASARPGRASSGSIIWTFILEKSPIVVPPVARVIPSLGSASSAGRAPGALYPVGSVPPGPQTFHDMPLISPESVEAVRQGADLVELVRDRVELVRRGGRWWGRCPFHEERSPSFSLLPPDFRRYYCHGCLRDRRRDHLDARAGGRGDLRRGRPGAGRALRHPGDASTRSRPRTWPAARPASGGGACSTGRRPSTPSSCGGPRRPRRRGSTWPAAGSTRSWCGGCGSGTRRGAAARSSGRASREGFARDGAGRRGPRPPARRQRSPTSSPRASCSRSPTARGG